MSDTDRIDLAHVPGFALGSLIVRPGTRELVRDDGAIEVLEPRVMQVLVALARAEGSIVTRDELSRWCWEGRVVGEDAINRVISRLRRAAEGIGEGAFKVETITKVGYRLVRAGEAAARVPVMTRMPRRSLIIGGAAAGTAILAGTGFVLWPRGRAAASPRRRR
ncbi:MAG: winged helix-turn-helix domain-containing protein [Sphingomonas sp.]